MALVEHLEELRTRVVRIGIILIVSFMICYNFSTEISNFLLQPLRIAIGTNGKIVFMGLLDKVLAELQISFWSCLFLASPFWFREVWLFIKPGLHEPEIKAIRPFLFFAFFLFVAGVTFGYYVLFPFTFKTIMSYGLADVEAMMDVKEYLLFSSKILVFLGLLFQLPNVMLILGFMELVTKQSLRSMRRYVIVAFAVFAAVITPSPDVLSMLCVWVPMLILYEIGVLAVAWVVHPYLAKKYA